MPIKGFRHVSSLDFARDLATLGWELFSTGQTQAVIAAAGVPVTSVADLTGSPEMLGGRVKTLHPKVHGGILARRNREDDTADLAAHGIGAIDMVVGNLYPFVQTVTRENVPTLAEALEEIDIGGPTMIRAAAKLSVHPGRSQSGSAVTTAAIPDWMTARAQSAHGYKVQYRVPPYRLVPVRAAL